ncbi:MAG: hypothetical protein WCZ17_03405 [Candidatus Kapaibacterium sp.]
MKKYVSHTLWMTLITLFTLLIAVELCSQDNVGIGTTNPDPSAILDLTASDKGFLPPRLSTSERNSISNPATGLIIYNITDQQYQYNAGTPGSPDWIPIISEGVQSIGLSMPSIFLISGTPLTEDGTINVTLDAQSPNTILAGPVTSPDSVPSFRQLVSNDIPNLNTSKITEGILPVERGGTGVVSITGMLKGNGAGDFSAVTNTSGNISFWSDANTIGGNANLIWDNTNKILAVNGSVKFIPAEDAPTAPTAGMTYYDSEDNKLYLYNGTEWIDISNSGSAMPNADEGQILRSAGGTDWVATSALRVNSSNIAIGSDSFSPSSILHSDAGNGTAHYHKFTAGTSTGVGANDGFDIGIDDNQNAVLRNHGNKGLIIATNNINRIRVNNDGNIAIGTMDNPVSLIHSDAGNGIAHYHKFTAGTSTGVGANDGFDIGIDANQNAILKQHGNADLILSTNGSERVIVTNEGRVGIGIDPAESVLMHLHKPGQFSVGAKFSNGGYENGMEIGIAADGRAEMHNLSKKSMDFSIDGDLILKLSESGYAGINESNPATSLHVGGGLSLVSAESSSSSITVGDRSYIKLNYSEDTTVTISDGAAGQILILQNTGTGVVTIDESGNTDLTGVWEGDSNDTLSLIFDGSKWVEIARSINNIY